MMLLIYQDFITENLTVRFTIPVFSVIFKNSAAITNTRRQLHEGMTIVCRSYVIGHKFINPIYEYGVK